MKGGGPVSSRAVGLHMKDPAGESFPVLEPLPGEGRGSLPRVCRAPGCECLTSTDSKKVGPLQQTLQGKFALVPAAKLTCLHSLGVGDS